MLLLFRLKVDNLTRLLDGFRYIRVEQRLKFLVHLKLIGWDLLCSERESWLSFLPCCRFPQTVGLAFYKLDSKFLDLQNCYVSWIWIQLGTGNTHSSSPCSPCRVYAGSSSKRSDVPSSIVDCNKYCSGSTYVRTFYAFKNSNVFIMFINCC